MACDIHCLKHYLIAAFGTTGDVNPLLAIGAGLKCAGHKVTFIANPVFGSHATAAGLSFIPVGTEADHQLSVLNDRMWTWWRGTGHAIRAYMIPNLAPAYDIIASAQSSGPIVLVANHLVLGACIASEKFHLPLAIIIPSPFYLPTLHEASRYGPLRLAGGKFVRRGIHRCLDFYLGRYLMNAVNQFRESVGLPGASCRFFNWVSSARLIVGIWPDWFAKIQPDWPSQVALSGFLNYDRSELHPSCLANSSKEDEVRPIVMTVGSAVARAEDFVKVAAETSRLLDRPFVVTAAHRMKHEFPTSASVRLVGYTPFSQLLPKSAAMINHGGIGTISAALAAGIPQIMIPLAFDQFENSARAQKLGAGTVLFRRHLKPERLARALISLLNSPELVERCQRLKDQIHPESALQRVCHLIQNDLAPRD